MARAIELGERGWGRTFPNPLVGAVIVRDGIEVGAGYHAEFGEAHAEPVALAAAGEHARGATMYVTLEPCTHHGKTAPCAVGIIGAGIARVVIACGDPNPVASGGIAQLRAAGVDVQVGVLARKAARSNFRFLRSFTSPVRPFVAVKLAVSMDGRIADADGNSRWVSGLSARAWVQWLRAGFGAVGIGAASAIRDGARLTVRGSLQPRQPVARVVFDRSARLDASAPVLAADTGAPIFVVANDSAPAEYRTRIATTGATLLLENTLPSSLAALQRAGIESLLVEGGGRLAGALMHGAMVDRVYQIQSPIWLGDGIDAWTHAASDRIESAARWTLVDAQPLGADGDTLIVLEP